MIIQSTFVPAWWLPGAHAQTMWTSFFPRVIPLETRRERLETPDGDFIDLDWVGEGDGPIVVILHGLEGSIESDYARGLLTEALDRGWRGVLLHFRGCSGEPNRLPQSYHSGYTGDINWFIQEIRKREPNTQIAVVGYSLGGNVLLKWLGETGIQDQIACAVAVCVPFELHKAANRLQSGLSRIYQWYLVSRMRSSVKRKLESHQLPIKEADLQDTKDFWSFDEKVTAPIHGFESAYDYYKVTSSRQYLHKIKAHTHIIHAKDDPFMVPELIPTEAELSDSTILELSEYGGHVGFIAGSSPKQPIFWLEHRIPEILTEQFEKTPQDLSE